MGAECNCVKDDKEEEFRIGSGNYSFKKMVYNKYFNIDKFFYIIQIIPRSQSESMFYGKDIAYEKEVKNKIDRTSSLIRNGVREYSNGNVDIIVPCAGNN